MIFPRKAFGLFLWIFGLVPVASSEQDAPQRPNFILIVADDLGFGDLACYGHPYAKTPNIDRLAKDGTSFRQFHVNGNVCPNTRAGLMTSRNPSWFPNETDDFGFLGALTVTKLLQDAGYTTGHIGKWHIGPDPDEDAIDYPEYGISDLRFMTDSIGNDTRGREGERFDVAINFLEEHKDESFYLNLWVYAPHTIIDPPQSFIDEFSELQVDRDDFGEHMQDKFDVLEALGGNITQMMRLYVAEIYALDIQVGRLLDKLDVLNLTDNTLVVFASDNGPERLQNDRKEAMGYAGGLRGEKYTFYEGGTRVPFIVRWPDKIPAGRVDDTSIMFGVDWLTTVGSLAGADIPWNLVEGEDMSDVWLGNSRSRTNPLFFREWQTYDKAYMRYGRWKLLKDEKELYDLEMDPEERNNIYDESPSIVTELLKSMDAWEATLPTGHARAGNVPQPFDPTDPAPEILLPDIDDAFPNQSKATSSAANSSPAGVPEPPPSVSPPMRLYMPEPKSPAPVASEPMALVLESPVPADVSRAALTPVPFVLVTIIWFI